MLKKQLIKWSMSLAVIALLLGACPCEVTLPPAWSSLTNTVADRMTDLQASGVMQFLTNLQTPVPQLQQLQYKMPNSTVALLGAVQAQGLALNKAEKIAAHLQVSASKLSGRLLRNFDEETAQSIERDWRDYERVAAL